jgi:hypothetical protein
LSDGAPDADPDYKGGMTPKEECEGMMDELIGSAEERLVQDGEFHPFAAILGEDGQVQQVASMPVSPGGPDVVGRLVAALQARAAGSQPVRAACIVALVSVERPGTQDAVDAIRMALDHRQGYAAHVFFPYRLRSDEGNAGEPAQPREVILGEPFATRGVSFAFRGERYPG